MSEDAFTLDSLLDDLDAVVVQHHPQSSAATTKFTPHPPSAKHTQQNPKAKFAVRPGSSHSSPEAYDRGTRQHMGAPPTSADADENSIDHLLNLIGSPQPQPVVQQKAFGQSATAPFSPVAKTAVASQYQYQGMSSSNRPTTFFGADLGSRAPHSAHHSAQDMSAGGCEGSGISSPWDSPSSHGSTGRKTFGGQEFSTGLGQLPSAVSQPLQLPSAGTGTGSGATGSGTLFGPLAALQSGNQGSSSGLFLRGATSLSAGNNSNNNNSSSSGPPRSIGSLQEAMGAGSGSQYQFTGDPSSSSSGWGGDKRESFLPAAGAGAAATSLPSGAGAATKQRCSKVVIAGSAVQRGRKASSFASIACDNLRCLQCNFRVHCFSGSAWDSSVDYLFLRNTVPNEAKLAARLVRREASCAYCCQCSFAAEDGQRELQPQASRGDPQWICAGH